MKFQGILSFLLLTAVLACKKDAGIISRIPEIRFVGVSPLQVKEYKDQISFTIYYRDGDGDLGENQADAKNLFLVDGRNGVTYRYRIQQLAPNGAKIAIEGNLNVLLNNTGITDNSNVQSVTYSLYVVDRAGNKSNTITSPSVTVSK